MQHQGVDAGFERLSKEILDARWAFYPTAGAKLGLHQYDGTLPDLSQGAVQRRGREIGDGLDRLAAFDPERLTTRERMDHALLELALRRERSELEELRVLETDPMKQLGYLNVTNYVLVVGPRGITLPSRRGYIHSPSYCPWCPTSLRP